MTHFELDPCTNCKSNRWELGAREARTGATEFKCSTCANMVYIRTTAAGFRHLAGDQ